MASLMGVLSAGGGGHANAEGEESQLVIIFQYIFLLPNHTNTQHLLLLFLLVFDVVLHLFLDPFTTFQQIVVCCVMCCSILFFCKKHQFQLSLVVVV